MQLSHAPSHMSAVFDDENLVSCAGVAPALGLAERAGLSALVDARLMLPRSGGAGTNAAAKVSCLLAGMLAGADSIQDMDLLRHGAMGRLFGGVRAPSTLGTFLRLFTFGHVKQLHAVATRLLVALATVVVPVAGGGAGLLAGADRVCWVDVDDTVKRTYGYAKQGAGYGYTGVKGLNALLAVVSSPHCRPVFAACRLRAGSANSARGAAGLVASAVRTAKACGAAAPGNGANGGPGLLVVRADSAFYGWAVAAAARRNGAFFSVTARMDKAVSAAVAAIKHDAWTAIRYPDAVWDEQDRRWVSEAEVAETTFIAFTGRRKGEQITARLIVRRVKRLNPTTPAAVKAGAEQGELFAAYRHHAVFTDSPLVLVQAEQAHRDHAIVEQVISDLKAGPLAHLPSGSFHANAAWLTLAVMAYNLTRATAVAAGTGHARQTSATVRRQLINVPARLASSARRLTLHLPARWPWQQGLANLFRYALGPPPATSR